MTTTPAATPALRLTRRGRIVLVGFLVLLAGLIAVAAARDAAATGRVVPPSIYRKGLSQVVVQPGDSLWSIADRAEPDADPRLVVQQIADLNGLPDGRISAGQLLWVPTK